MKRKIIGYFDGIDSEVLTHLICDGYETIPISNGLDNHGRHIRLLNEENKIDLLMGYLHKIHASADDETQPEDVFHICQTYQIPFLIVVPSELHDRIRQMFDKCPNMVMFVDPSETLKLAQKILKSSTE